MKIVDEHPWFTVARSFRKAGPKRPWMAEFSVTRSLGFADATATRLRRGFGSQGAAERWIKRLIPKIKAELMRLRFVGRSAAH